MVRASKSVSVPAQSINECCESLVVGGVAVKEALVVSTGSLHVSLAQQHTCDHLLFTEDAIQHNTQNDNSTMNKGKIPIIGFELRYFCFG